MDLGAPITSRSNARVKALRASLSGQARQPGDLLGLEGEHLLREAHSAGLSFEAVYLREGSEGLLGGEASWWRTQLRTGSWAVLSREIFDSAVTTVTPQGIAATWAIRDPVPRSKQPGSALIIENLQDPGNLGTLIRSSAGFGMERVFVTPETVNQWNPKVVRAAAGAIFHTLIQRSPLDEIVLQLRSERVRIFAAVSDFLSGPEHGFPVLAAPHGVLTGRVDNAKSPQDNRYNFPDSQDPANSYAASFSFDADLVEPCAILVGNEGAGLSQTARALADEQVCIPGSFESLNVAVAGSVLLYEVMRQRTLRLWARKRGLRP